MSSLVRRDVTGVIVKEMIEDSISFLVCFDDLFQDSDLD